MVENFEKAGFEKVEKVIILTPGVDNYDDKEGKLIYDDEGNYNISKGGGIKLSLPSGEYVVLSALHVVKDLDLIKTYPNGVYSLPSDAKLIINSNNEVADASKINPEYKLSDYDGNINPDVQKLSKDDQVWVVKDDNIALDLAFIGTKQAVNTAIKMMIDKMNIPSIYEIRKSLAGNNHPVAKMYTNRVTEQATNKTGLLPNILDTHSQSSFPLNMKTLQSTNTVNPSDPGGAYVIYNGPESGYSSVLFPGATFGGTSGEVSYAKKDDGTQFITIHNGATGYGPLLEKPDPNNLENVKTLMQQDFKLTQPYILELMKAYDVTYDQAYEILANYVNENGLSYVSFLTKEHLLKLYLYTLEGKTAPSLP